jgi:hypothetical protein
MFHLADMHHWLDAGNQAGFSVCLRLRNHVDFGVGCLFQQF